MTGVQTCALPIWAHAYTGEGNRKTEKGARPTRSGQPVGLLVWSYLWPLKLCIRIPELDKTMTIAKAISGTLRTVTTTGTFRTATISTGGGEYNMTGWHVRPLHHGAASLRV